MTGDGEGRRTGDRRYLCSCNRSRVTQVASIVRLASAIRDYWRVAKGVFGLDLERVPEMDWLS